MRTNWTHFSLDDDFEYHFFDVSIAAFYVSDLRIQPCSPGLQVFQFLSVAWLAGPGGITPDKKKQSDQYPQNSWRDQHAGASLTSREVFLLDFVLYIVVAPLAWLAMTHWLQGFADQMFIASRDFNKVFGSILLFVKIRIQQSVD